MAVAGSIFDAAIGGWMNDRAKAIDFGRRCSLLRSTNSLLITGGQFLSYLINLAFTHPPVTWHWMLGVAGLPAVVQFFLMLSLPESPRVEEARSILEKIYPANEVEAELTALKNSIEAEKADEQAIGDNLIAKLKGALGNVVVRRGLYAGVTVQVAQQFSGIKHGYVLQSNNSSVSWIRFEQDSIGAFFDHIRSQRAQFNFVFFQAASHAPKISQFKSTHFAANGACLAKTRDLENSCHRQNRTWFKEGCPSKFGVLAVVFLGLYIISFSPGMGAVPWIVNSEIYPLKYRGLGEGIAAVCNWTSNLIVSLTFLTLTKTLVPPAHSFSLLAIVSSDSFSFTGLFLKPKGCKLRKLR
ncbi:putative F-box and associated interaction domains-containing protein [Hibiscus syriacus]|uniref:F-box and associated interaction domains-containing protein n=1 Tax=Hibiscus syriacus TaxID=106335 RepID=A0A6A3C7A0_HIBSY|nr:putative F-box and associated interaction domains-containing protein [Hibiscus syriacus]